MTESGIMEGKDRLRHPAGVFPYKIRNGVSLGAHEPAETEAAVQAESDEPEAQPTESKDDAPAAEASQDDAGTESEDTDDAADEAVEED